MLNVRYTNQGCRKLTHLIMSIIVVALVCGCTDDEPNFVSVHDLRINQDRYIDKRVVVKGFLSGRYAEGHGDPYLYATTDDAIMRNHAAAVFIDLFENEWINDLSGCSEEFVQVWGRFMRTHNPDNPGLAISEVESLSTQPPRGGDVEEFCVGPAPTDWEVGHKDA